MKHLLIILCTLSATVSQPMVYFYCGDKNLTVTRERKTLVGTQWNTIKNNITLTPGTSLTVKKNDLFYIRSNLQRFNSGTNLIKLNVTTDTNFFPASGPLSLKVLATMQLYRNAINQRTKTVVAELTNLEVYSPEGGCITFKDGHMKLKFHESIKTWFEDQTQNEVSAVN